MTEHLVTIIVAVVSAGGALLVAQLTTKRTAKAQAEQSIHASNSKYRKDNHLLYMWNRQLVDHIYKQAPPPPPAPPKGLFE